MADYRAIQSDKVTEETYLEGEIEVLGIGDRRFGDEGAAEVQKHFDVRIRPTAIAMPRD